MEPTKVTLIDLVDAFPLDGDNLFTAARRIIRFIRGDDERHGGLLSKDTVQANELLAKHVDQMERVIKYVQAQREAAAAVHRDLHPPREGQPLDGSVVP